MRARAIFPLLMVIVALAVPGSGLGRETGPESGPGTSASAAGEIRLAGQFDNAELVTVVQAIAAGAGQPFLALRDRGSSPSVVVVPRVER